MLFLAARTFLFQFKKPLQFVEVSLSCFIRLIQGFVLYVKNRNKFQFFFCLRISNSHLYLACTCSHCLLLHLSSSDEIDIFDINRWKSIEIEL